MVLNHWDYSGVDQVCFSDSEQGSYKKAAQFLGDTVEDWGGGTGWAKQFFTNYTNIDGSVSNHTDIHADLTEYTSDCDNILMRQALEANAEWDKILDNVKASFNNKFCLVIMTPFSDETHIYVTEPVIEANGQEREGAFISLYSFNKQDILDKFPQDEFSISEETIETQQGYGEEWILYVTRT
jgi:hypothetical protein